MHRRLWLNSKWMVGLLLSFWASPASVALAESKPADNLSVVERIGNTAKKIGNKIEQGLTKAGRKIKEKKIGEKIEYKFEKAVTKAEEEFNKAGKKIDERFR